MKRFFHDRCLQIYMYVLMYVDTETMPVKDRFADTETSVVNCKKMSTSGTVQKHWLGFTYICL